MLGILAVNVLSFAAPVPTQPLGRDAALPAGVVATHADAARDRRALIG